MLAFWGNNEAENPHIVQVCWKERDTLIEQSVIKTESCLSVCPSKFRWRSTIFSRPEGRLEAIFVPNEVLIIQE